MPVSNNPIQDTYTSQENENINTTEVVEQPVQIEEVTEVTGAQTTSIENTGGLTAAELNDPNSIVVTVADTQSPLVVLFGPPSCGKTMTLVRLTRFLKMEGYTVAPIRSFRPSADTNYKEICDKFDEMISSDNAADSTKRINFMLVEVSRNNRRICQILEAPGEYYFNPQKPSNPFPSYVNTIISNSNRKIWTIMTEPDWMDMPDRNNYVNKIRQLKKSMRPIDSTIFIFNKIDKTNCVRGIGNVDIPEAIKNVEFLYPGIFVPFVSQNPITKWFKKYNCEFVPFQTGTYTPTISGKTAYQEGPREYCVQLWNKISKKIFG